MMERQQEFESETMEEKKIPMMSVEENGKQEKTTTASIATETTASYALPELHFSWVPTYVVFYVLFLLLCNLIIPCVLYYPLEDLTELTDKEVVGISSAALGISSCFDAPFRLFRLVKHRKFYGPLGNDTWWYLDFTMWTYTFALFVFAIPLAIAPALKLYNFFLMSTALLVGPVGLVLLISLFRPKLPFCCSSDPAGVPMKPAVFYLIEDVSSVDFKRGREYRQSIHERWHASPPFRRLMLHLTIYWTISSAVYCGITAAVSWTTPLRFAFAWTLSQLFVWAGVSTLGSIYLAKKGMRDERKWLREQGTKSAGSLS